MQFFEQMLSGYPEVVALLSLILLINGGLTVFSQFYTRRFKESIQKVSLVRLAQQWNEMKEFFDDRKFSNIRENLNNIFKGDLVEGRLGELIYLLENKMDTSSCVELREALKRIQKISGLTPSCKKDFNNLNEIMVSEFDILKVIISSREN